MSKKITGKKLIKIETKILIFTLLTFSFCMFLTSRALGFTETKTGEVASNNSFMLSKNLIDSITGPPAYSPGDIAGKCGPGEYTGYCWFNPTVMGLTGVTEDCSTWCPMGSESSTCSKTCRVLVPQTTSSRYEVCGLNCNHKNDYNYTFAYLAKQGDTWNDVASNNMNKCDEIKLSFSPQAEWSADAKRQCSTETETSTTYSFLYSYSYPTPPTDILACSGQDDCLSKGTEYSLTTDTFGKGVQKTPADFVTQTEKSLTSSNPYMKCTDGICTSYTSGDFPMTATAPATSYFGQCRGYGATINTPEAPVPAVTSSTNVNIVNRAPVPTVAFAKNPINVNEETDVTCDIVDPDECSDKITKVKWTCSDSNGNTGNCFIWKEQTGQFNAGSSIQNLVPSEQNNPFRATAKFKATQTGNYAVTCEAWDDDANNPMSGTGINGISVVQNCEADGICNSNCPNDPDCGVVAAHNGYCALLSDGGGSDNSICGGSGQSKYKAYYSGIDPATYKWKCSADAPVSETADPKITCNYGNTGSYLPTLSIVDKNGTETSCVTQTSASVVSAGNGSCQLKLRPAGTGDDFTSKLTKIGSQDQIEAKVDKRCVSNGATKWTVSGGSILDQSNGSALIKFDNLGESNVKAEVTTPDGKIYDCGQVKVDTTDKVQFGT